MTIFLLLRLLEENQNFLQSATKIKLFEGRELGGEAEVDMLDSGRDFTEQTERVKKKQTNGREKSGEGFLW